MEKQPAFSCYVIGNDSLTLHCASILAEKQHLLGIVSTSNHIKSWCEKNRIPCMSTLAALEEHSSDRSYDYLFSIVNEMILTDSILQHPCIHAINYHNSLLPKYAGLYATSWAIINNENEHGISWHVMESKIDSGDIIKQCPVPIDTHDTALTLNLKCYETAVESFNALVEELALKKIRRVPQNALMRSYSGLKDKPNNLGFISWEYSAEEIDRLCRALSFGVYRNELAIPKILIHGEIYQIIAHRKLHVSSKKAPGTIVHLSKNEMQITTRTVDIVLLKLMDVNGTLYDMEQWSTRCSLFVGQQLPSVPRHLIEQLMNHPAVCMPKTEQFWVREHAHYIHQEHACLAQLKRAVTPYLGKKSSLVLPEHIKRQLQDYAATLQLNASDVLYAVVILYLYRLNDYKNCSIQVQNTILTRSLDELTFFLSKQLPFTTQITPRASFEEVVLRSAHLLLHIASHYTFCTDLFIRYPELHHPAKELLICFIEEKELSHALQDEYKLIIFISNDGGAVHIQNNTNFRENTTSHAFFNHIEEHMANLLEEGLNHPEKKVFELTLLSDEELGLFDAWNQTDYAYDTTQLLHQLITQHSAQRSYETAAYYDGTTISYALLEQKANQLAQYLITLGIKPNDIVGLYLGRSLDAVFSILAILKAGAAYLPLDLHYPEQRIVYMLENAKARCIITNEGHSLPYQCTVIDLRQCAYDRFPSSAPEIKTNATDLAYIIYTSGTTGTPKGVAITHQSACNHMIWMYNTYPFSKADRFLLKTPLSFDASVWELFMPLLVGGLLVIAPDEAHAHPKELVDLIMHHQITIIQLVPSMLRELTLTRGFGDCTSLNHVFCGGEALLPETIHGFFEHNTFQAQLYNLYGPTEATIDAITRICAIEDSERPISLIGTPIFNTKAYILDKYMQRVPAGILGELYLSGHGLAQGYLNNPELTQKKFLPNPFRTAERIYKTGDLVKWKSTGEIEYHGRSDEQIKIRGLRIEISEIESCLEKIHSVYQCMVKAERTSEGAIYLSAYIVLQEHTQLSANEVRIALKKELPDYMIPSQLHIVDKLFFTPNGKLDRTHTPIPIKQLTLTTAHKVPETEMQHRVHQIWCSVLNKDALSILDDFFEQGGHSLLAIQIITQIHALYPIKLSIRALFDHPTIESLTKEVELLMDKEHTSPDGSATVLHSLIPLKKSGHKTPVFLIHPVGGGIFWYNSLVPYFDAYRPLYAIQDPSLESQSLCFKTLHEMAAQYVALIKQIQPHGPYIVGGASFGATVAIEMAHQLQNTHYEVSAIISLDGWAEYPALQSNERFFKEMMAEHNARLLEQYKKYHMPAPERLLEIQWHRENMLMNYQIPRIKAPLVLFKATHLTPVFQYDAPLNWWDEYTDRPIECHLVPGDHESMFHENNSKILAEMLCNSLRDKENE